jgi:hypothetical protein
VLAADVVLVPIYRRGEAPALDGGATIERAIAAAGLSDDIRDESRLVRLHGLGGAALGSLEVHG